jgi:hypothetical protein
LPLPWLLLPPPVQQLPPEVEEAQAEVLARVTRVPSRPSTQHTSSISFVAEAVETV